MIYLLLFIAIIVLVYSRVKRAHRYWLDRGVSHRKPVFLLGDTSDTIFKKTSVFGTLIDLYNAFPNERYVGMYQIMLPTLVLRDPELIKAITVKDFDHFVDHRQFIPADANSTWARTLFSLKGVQWKHMRSAVGPTFTSSKMKTIFFTVTEGVNTYMDYLKKNEGPVEIELKDTFSRFTNDVIASVAYGVKCDSINDRDNEFYRMGKQLTTFSLLGFVRSFSYTVAPSLCKALGFTIMDQPAMDFLNNIMTESIKARVEKGIKRADMISLLLEERKHRETSSGGEQKAELTDLDIAAQAFIFFFAGFDTVSTLLTFMTYELTVNPDIQAKLQKEIDEVLVECNGKLTYDALMKMKYMDMVLSETLRIWPPAVGADRQCTKAYTIEPTSPTEKKIEIKVGDIVWVPLNALHRDPKYFPDPMKFDPERFSDENKDSIQPYTYMPFGNGPRICIGARLGQLEVKTMIFNLLAKFDFVVNERTEIPLQISKLSFDVRPANKLFITLRPRNK